MIAVLQAALSYHAIMQSRAAIVSVKHSHPKTPSKLRQCTKNKMKTLNMQKLPLQPHTSVISFTVLHCLSETGLNTLSSSVHSRVLIRYLQGADSLYAITDDFCKMSHWTWGLAVHFIWHANMFQMQPPFRVESI